MASSIVKMHGDLRHEEHIIVTQRDYDDFMGRYPVVATHLSAMLITRTPLFLGYSLSDPDFANIRKVVRSRLGEFERMAYVIQFDVDEDAVEEALHQRLHIISLSTVKGKSRDDILRDFFAAIQAQLDTRAGVALRTSRPDLFEPVETELVEKAVQSVAGVPVAEATSRMCFVMMPFGDRFDAVYRMLIGPVVAQHGLSVLRADEIAAPGFIMEQIRSAIQQSRLCIADVTGNNPNVLYELGYAQALSKPVILMVESFSNLPFDVAHQRVIKYGPELEPALDPLYDAIALLLSEDRMEEAMRLFKSKQYRGAIAAAAVVLEHAFRGLLKKKHPSQLVNMSLGSMAVELVRRRMIKRNQYAELRAVIDLRNRAVHEILEPSKSDAELVLNRVRNLLNSLAGQT